MNFRLKGLGLALFFLALPCLAWAGDPAERETLRGLGSVSVQVHTDVAVEKYGVTSQRILAMAKDLLVKSGVKVAKPDESRALLWICVISTAKGQTEPEKPHAVLVSVELLQPVTLVRRPSVTTFTRTWADEILALYRPAKMQGINKDVVNLLGKFLSDHKSVN